MKSLFDKQFQFVMKSQGQCSFAHALAAAHAAMAQYPQAVENMRLAIGAAKKERRSRAEVDRYHKTLSDYESKKRQ